jgi:integrase
MPAQKRFKTDYPGVTFIEGTSIATGKPERIFMIRYRKGEKDIEEQAGRAGKGMTAAKAARLRAEKIEGKRLTNKERREAREKEKRERDHRWTLSKLWESYEENSIGKDSVNDKNRFEKHIKPIFGDKEPKDLSPFDVDKFRLTLSKKLKTGTVKNIMELLRRLINYGIKKGVVDPLRFKVTMPKGTSQKTEDLTQDQIKKLLEVIEKDTHPLAGPMMKMALYSGMRRGEMFKLLWKDVDFDRGFIHLRDPKGGPDQIIPLNEAARKVLDSLPRTSGFVFPGRDGEQRVDIHKAANEIKRKAGVPSDFRAFHGLRHVFASGLASSGKVDLYTLQKLLTHKSPMMTQRYAHLRDEALRKASELAGQLVNEATKTEKKAEVVNLDEKRG